MPVHFHIAVEDQISESVLRKIVEFCDQGLAVHRSIIGRGFGYLKANIENFNKAARNGVPFVVLTDLDNPNICAADKIRSWIRTTHPNLVFRVAVCEVEAWLLGDREGFSGFLGVDVIRIPVAVDEIDDPKRLLVQLASSSRSSRLRRDLVPSQGSTSSQGPNYSATLISFINESWDVENACRYSESLRRAVDRICGFEAVDPGM